MNAIVNKLSLAGDKFMPEIHLKQPGFTYSKSGPFIKKQETVDSRYIYQNELDKACFQYYIAYGEFKDLNRRTAVDKGFRQNMMNINVNLLQQAVSFLIQKLQVEQSKMKIFLIKN